MKRSRFCARISVRLLATCSIVFGCSSGNSNDGDGGGTGSGAGDGDTGGSLQITTTFDPKDYEGISASYSLTNGEAPPSAADSYSKVLPSALAIGSGFGLLGDQGLGLNSTCLPKPPSAEMRALSGQARTEWIGTCRNSSGNDVAKGNCDGEIDDDDQWIDPNNIEYTYQNGLQSRFYSGCGPTDIYLGLVQVDEGVFEDIERRIENGEFRCVDVPDFHKSFTANIAGATFGDALLGEESYPLACSEEGNDNRYSAFGKANVNDKKIFYYWGYRGTTEMVRVAEDGSEMDYYRTFGDIDNPFGGSSGGYRLQTREQEDGTKTMHMTLLGNNIGPGCGAYITTYKSATGDVDLVYMEALTPGGNIQSWAAWNTACTNALNGNQTRKYCLKGSFEPATGSDPETLTACESAGMHTPPSGFKKWIFNAVASGNSKGYVDAFDIVGAAENPINEDGLEFDDLVATADVKDPMKVMADRVFAAQVSQAFDLSGYVEDANLLIAGYIANLTERNPKCAFDPLVSLNHDAEWSEIPTDPLRLNCNAEMYFGGIEEDTIYIWQQNPQERKAMITSDSALDLWHIRSDGSSSEWSNSTEGSMYVRAHIDQKDDINFQEVAFIGDGDWIPDMGCGVHYLRRTSEDLDLVYVEGKFSASNCDTSHFDRDCLKYENEAFTRLPLSACQDEEGNVPFTFETIQRSDLSREEIAELGSLEITESLGSTTAEPE